MRPVRARENPPPRRRWGLWAGTGLAVFALLLAASPALAWGDYQDPVAWTNGTVLCQFAASTPMVGVSALSVRESGLTASLVGLSEVRANGSVAATADLSGQAWNVANLSDDDAYDLEFTITAPIEAAPSSAGTVGSVNLSVQFVLPAYDGSPDGAVDQVMIVVAETGWTWQGPGDHLEMILGAAPTVSSTEHLVASTAAGWLLSSVANASGTEREQLGTNSTALVSSPGRPGTTVAANASLALPSSEQATVAVAFGSGAGEFSALTFVSRVGVVLPATIAGIPLPELLAAAGAATLVSILVAVGARRLRRRPSRLIYAEDEP
jgi:hypothetical protein